MGGEVVGRISNPSGQRGGIEKPPHSPARPWAVALALAFAVGFPSLMAWVEFAVLARSGDLATTAAEGGSNRLVQAAYAGGKVFQFSLPVLFFRLFERRWPRPGVPNFRGLALGLGFGLAVAAGMLALYFALRDQSLFRQTPGKLKDKLQEFGLDSPAGFAAFAFFVTVLHSLCEEYYWRWFVFGWLRRYLAFVPAAAVSSLGFMAFHVFLLHAYLPGHFWAGVVPLLLCIAAGGAAWAWLYERTGSVYSPWLSHAIIDAALFVVGY